MEQNKEGVALQAISPGPFVRTVAFSTDGKTVAGAGAMRDGVVRLWDTTTGKDRCPLNGHVGQVSAVAISPDCKTVISAGMDRTLRLWDTVTNKELAMQSLAGPGMILAISPDGKTLVTPGKEGGLCVRDATTLQERLNLKGQTGVISHVAYSADGKKLATAGFVGL